jgi:hypothetical protein
MRIHSLLVPIAAAALFVLPVVANAQSPVTVKEEKPGLLKQAKVQPADAQATALGHVPNGTITKAEIEREHKLLIYSFDISVPGKSGITEVHVNALTGKVLSTTHEKSEVTAAKATTPAKPATPATPVKPAAAAATPAPTRKP